MVMPTEGVSQSSIEVKQTAKGEVQVTVKIYQNPDGTLDMPSQTVGTLDVTLRKLRASGHRVVGES